MKNLLCVLGIAGATLIAGNAYSQNYVNVEEVKKEYRALDKPAKELSSISVYTNPTSIKFDSLDEITKKRAWSILANHYEMQVEQYENKLKDYEAVKVKLNTSESEIKTLTSDKANLQDDFNKCNEILRDNNLLPKEDKKK